MNTCFTVRDPGVVDKFSEMKTRWPGRYRFMDGRYRVAPIHEKYRIDTI